jgi:hypothetical protein
MLSPASPTASPRQVRSGDDALSSPFQLRTEVPGEAIQHEQLYRVRSTLMRGRPPTRTSVTTFLGLLVVVLAACSCAKSNQPERPELGVKVSGNTLETLSGQPIQLRGVDIAGTESACVTGKTTISWGETRAQQADALKQWGVDVVRVPLNEDCWLGINGAPNRYAASNYRSGIKTWVQDLNSAGLEVILDLHWSAPAGIVASQQWPMADADHATSFWTQVAADYGLDAGVIFDLFNEPALGGNTPSAADWECWLKGCESSYRLCRPSQSCNSVGYRVAGMQQLVDAVRSTGATQPIMVAGLNWSGDPCGVYDSNRRSNQCMWLGYEPRDPRHQLIVSFHTYNWTACSTMQCWDDSVVRVAKSVPVITGEFGERDCGSVYDSEYMDWADLHDISYLAWAWDPPSDAGSCVASNLSLLRDWGGTPSDRPGPQAIYNHLHAIRPSREG